MYQTLVYDEQNVYLNGLLHRHEQVVIQGRVILLLLQGKGLEDRLQRRVSLALIIRYIMTKVLI